MPLLQNCIIDTAWLVMLPMSTPSCEILYSLRVNSAGKTTTDHYSSCIIYIYYINDFDTSWYNTDAKLSSIYYFEHHIFFLFLYQRWTYTLRFHIQPDTTSLLSTSTTTHTQYMSRHHLPTRTHSHPDTTTILRLWLPDIACFLRFFLLLLDILLPSTTCNSFCLYFAFSDSQVFSFWIVAFSLFAPLCSVWWFKERNIQLQSLSLTTHILWDWLKKQLLELSEI